MPRPALAQAVERLEAGGAPAKPRGSSRTRAARARRAPSSTRPRARGSARSIPAPSRARGSPRLGPCGRGAACSARERNARSDRAMRARSGPAARKRPISRGIEGALATLPELPRQSRPWSGQGCWSSLAVLPRHWIPERSVHAAPTTSGTTAVFTSTPPGPRTWHRTAPGRARATIRTTIRRDTPWRSSNEGSRAAADEAKHRQDPHDPCGQPSAAADLLDMLDSRAAGRPLDQAAYAVRLREAVGDVVQRQVRARGRRHRRRRAEQARVHPLRQRAPRGLRAEPRCAGAEHLGPVPRGPGVPRVLRLVRPPASESRRDGRAPGLHGPDRLQGPRAAPGRPRQSESRGRRRGPHRGLRSGHLALERGVLAPERLLHDAGGVPLCHRRGDARGIPGHRRRGIPAPDRRSATGDVLDSRAEPDLAECRAGAGHASTR